MAIKTGSKIVPSFPDVKVPEGGRFGGALLGLKTAQAQGDVNRKFGQAEKLLGIQERAATTKASTAESKNLVSLYNKQASLMNDRNKEKIKALSDFDEWGNSTLETMPSFNEFKATMLGGAETTGGDVTPSGGAGLLTGDQSNAVVPPTPNGMQSPQGGQNILQQMGGDIQQVLENILGPPPNAAQAPTSAPTNQPFGQPTVRAGGTPPQNVAGLTTDDLLTALDDYDSADEAIADILALDEQFNQAGFELGPDVDADAILEAFRAKFGDEAVQKLMSQVQ